MANQHTTPRDPAVRFWSKVRVRGLDQCWPWKGGRDRQGYGQFYNRGAHRQAWFLISGAMPALCVLHRCDNPPCCNPCHLWLGTQQDNQRDKFEKGRTPRGENHYCAKLTIADVREIRRAASLGVGQSALARVYGVKPPMVHRIVHRRAWKHVA
jgi:hypothetical protein